MKVSKSNRSLLRDAKTVLICSSGAAALLGASSPAWSQSPPAASESQPAAPQSEYATNEGRGLADIIVTAQRRGQNLQDVPISVTAFRGETLATRGVAKALDLQQVDSSLQISAQASVVTPFLRGIGNPSAVAGNEASVPIYIDDVYYSRLTTAYLALANIDRVEVLKGPQGTLFGRNATGGLIQIFTRDPDQEAVVDAMVGYGNYQTYSGKLYASTPLGPDVAFGISAVGSNQVDGWGRNIFNGEPTYRNKFYNLRSKLVAQISDNTKIRISGYYVYQKTGQAIVNVVYDGYTRGLPPTFSTPFVPPSGFYDLNTNTETFARDRSYGGSIKIDQKLGFADATSITSYRKGTGLYRSEGDHTEANFLRYDIYLRDRQITQEFQLKSKAGSDINWILGAFYLNSLQGYRPTILSGDAVTGPASAPTGLSSANLYSLQTTNSYSTFGQATFPVIDEKSNITLGLRYTKDRIKGEGRQTVSFVNGTEFPTQPDYLQRANFHKLTYKVTIDHKFDSNLLTYITFSRGYKSGAFNTLPLDGPPTNPETVNSYEIGAKVTLFDRRLRANVAIFQNDIGDPQVQLVRLVNGVGVIAYANAGKAQTKGVDFDATALLAKGLTLDVAGQYLNAKFIDFQGAPFNYPVSTPPYGITATPVSGDASGNRMPQTPKYKLNIGLTYNVQANFGNVILSGNMAYRSSFKWDPDNILTEKALTLFNSSVTFSPKFNEQLSFRLWGNNLTNKRYYVAEIPQNGPVGYDAAVAEPRTYGIEVRYVF